MSRARHVEPLTGPPSLRWVRQPDLCEEMAREREAQHLRLVGGGKIGFDAPCVMCSGISEGELEVFEAPYSLRLAHSEMGERSNLGFGGVWCGCLLVDDADRCLLAKRPPWMAFDPSTWTVSCAGGLSPGEGPEEGMRREMKEELGLEADSAGLAPGVVSWDRPAPGRDVALIWTMRISVDTSLTTDAMEIDALGWFAFDALPANLAHGHREMLHAIRDTLV